MALSDLYNQAKKKLTDSVGSAVAFGNRNIKPVEDTQFFKKTTGFLSNLNTRPLSSRADSTLGKLAGGIVETPYTFLTSIPKTAGTGFKMAGNGEMFTRPGVQKFEGQVLESGLDTASMGLFGKAKAFKNAAMASIGPRVADGTLTSLIKQGTRQGLKTGGTYGAGYGLSEGMKQNEDLKGIAKRTATGGATGALFGTVFGGGIPAVSGLFKAAKHDLAVRRGQSFGKPESIPERKLYRDVATPREKEAGISVMENHRTLPAQTFDPNAPLMRRAMGEIGEAMPRPGMTVQDVSEGKKTNIADDIINSRKKSVDEVIQAEMDSMIDMKKNAEGPRMLNDGNENTPGHGNFYRVSDNPKWYSDFYAENGRAPGKAETYEIAKRNLEEGKGYLQDFYNEAKQAVQKEITPDDVNAIIPPVRPQTKGEIFQQPPRIFKNREYPKPPVPEGTFPSPSRLLEAPKTQLALPVGPLPTLSSKSKATNFMAKYGQAPEYKKEIQSSRPIFVGESGQASFSRNKSSGADVAEKLGESEFSDIGILGKGNLDIIRNFRRFFGKRSQEFVDKYIAPFQKSKDTMYKNLEARADELDRNIVKGLGIERGSKESAAVQEFGEGLRDKQSLVKEFGSDRAKNIIDANRWFRKQYDTLLSEINKAREYVYPNQPEKQIARRSDYYRHFRELQDGFQGLANIFETPAGIDNKLAGISDHTKPQSKWLSLAQKRLGLKTDVDAVGGYIDYIGAAEYAKNVDPQIRGFRQLAEQLAEQGNKTGKDYNNFISFLEKTADHLSGKTNSLDRGIQEFTGRKAFKVVDWLNRRVKANTILGNASSSLAQVFAIPAGISSAGEKNFYKGTKRFIGSINDDEAIMRQSPFLRERYFKAFDKFDKGIFQNTKKFAVWMVTALDEVSTKAIWNAHYEKALSEGIQNPIKYADEITGNIVGRRGIGETPLLQQSKTFQMIAPFQLEVANAWPLMKELNDAGKLKTLKLFTYTYLLNRGVEAIRGSDVAFDPIQAAIDGYNSQKDEDTIGKKALKFGGRMAGEVLSNVPLGQTIASVYPEYGAKDVFGSGVNLPTREKLFGKGDPTRFGSGLLAAKGLQDPLYKVLPPFGGTQLKRTVEGVGSWMKGYKENSGGKVQYPIEQNLRNLMQGGVFGPSSIPEGRDYYKNEKTPLGDVQSEKFKLGAGKDYYDRVMNDRKAEKEKEQAKSGEFVDTAKASELPNGMKRLSNGKVYVQSLDKEFQTEKAASKAIAIEDFKNSDKENMEYDGKFYYKDDSTESGYRTQNISTRKIDILTAQKESYREDKDVESWKKTANELYGLYAGMIADPKIDELEKMKIQNKIKDLVDDYTKVESKGLSGSGGKKKKYESISDSPSHLVKALEAKFGKSSKTRRSFSLPSIRQTRMNKVSRRAPKLVRI